MLTEGDKTSGPAPSTPTPTPTPGPSAASAACSPTTPQAHVPRDMRGRRIRVRCAMLATASRSRRPDRRATTRANSPVA